MSEKRTHDVKPPGARPDRGVGDHVMTADPHGGFEASLDRTARLVRIRLWGQWSVAIAEHFVATMLRFGDALLGHRWSILADSREFSAQSQEVARLRSESMARLVPKGCVKIAAISDKQVYSMQFRRITDQSHVASGVFRDESSALAWLAQDQPAKAR